MYSILQSRMNSNYKFQRLYLSIANLLNIFTYPIVWRKIRILWQSRKATAGRQMSMKKQRISATSLAKLFTGNCIWLINCLGLNLCLYINQRLLGNLTSEYRILLWILNIHDWAQNSHPAVVRVFPSLVDHGTLPKLLTSFS